MGNRKRSKIDKFPAPLKETVEQMILRPADFTYADIVSYISEQGYSISAGAVCNHAKNLMASLETLHMAQENFRVIMDEIARYPQLDTTEGILRLLSHHVMEAVRHVDEQQWKNLDPLKLIKEATGLARAAAYKSNVDLKNKEILDVGLEAVKALAFETMAKENPELYDQFSAFLDSQLRKGDPQ